MGFRILLFGLIISVNLNAQSLNTLYTTDTVRFESRIGGALDSIDLTNASVSTNLPGGPISKGVSVFTSDWIFANHGGQINQNFVRFSPMRFSGLPHLGFSYSFGSRGVQNVQMEYQQAFQHGLLLNIDYTKNKLNGFQRNSAFANNNVQLQLQKKGVFYSFTTKGAYLTSYFETSGGLISDSLANDFALLLLPVQKEQSFSKTARSQAEMTNYFDFNRDSLNSIGLYTFHELKIRNIKYSEISDTLSLIYSQTNFDNDTTADQNQWSQIGNGAGVYLHSSKINFLGGLNYNYWNYQNLGLFRDTVEINLKGEFNFTTSRLKLVSILDGNIIGAKNEFSSNTNAQLNFNSINVIGQLSIESKLPDYHQRFVQANNYSSFLSNYEKQQRVFASLRLKGSIKTLGYQFSSSFTALNNTYLFLNNQWTNDSLNALSLTQFGLRLNYSIGILNLQPSYYYSITAGTVQYTPQHQANLRVYLKGGLFKAKKLKAYIGLEGSYVSSYQRIGFNTLVGAYDFSVVSAAGNGPTNLHFFTGFQIDEFKFFFRFENIGYFWNDHKTTVLNGYTIPGTQFRLGITWDFFN